MNDQMGWANLQAHLQGLHGPDWGTQLGSFLGGLPEQLHPEILRRLARLVKGMV